MRSEGGIGVELMERVPKRGERGEGLEAHRQSRSPRAIDQGRNRAATASGGGHTRGEHGACSSPGLWSPRACTPHTGPGCRSRPASPGLTRGSMEPLHRLRPWLWCPVLVRCSQQAEDRPQGGHRSAESRDRRSGGRGRGDLQWLASHGGPRTRLARIARIHRRAVQVWKIRKAIGAYLQLARLPRSAAGAHGATDHPLCDADLRGLDWPLPPTKVEQGG